MQPAGSFSFGLSTVLGCGGGCKTFGYEEASSGVKASKARLMSQAESRRKKTAIIGQEENASRSRENGTFGEETKAPKNLNMKLNVITGQTFDTVSQGSKIQTIISVAGNQVIRN